MSFFFNSLVRAFLAERAIHLVSNEIRHEIEARNAAPTHHRHVDFAILFSGRAEQNAFLDRCGRTSTTQGGGITFHQTILNEKSVVFVDVASDPAAISETIIDIFHPKHVISAGFAKSLHANAKNQLFIPTRIVTSQSAVFFDIWNPSLIEGPRTREDFQEKNGEKNDFCSGILCSGRPTQMILDKFAPFAVDQSTYFVIDVCRRRNIPCFPLIAMTSQYNSKNDLFQQHGFARKFGLFLNKTWNNPKYALDSASHQMNLLETGDVLAKAILKLFFPNLSSETTNINV